MLEFAVPEDQPTYIGLTNTLLAPVTFFAPILGGWVATSFDYNSLFTLTLLCGVAGGALLALWVKEPRHIPPEPMGGTKAA